MYSDGVAVVLGDPVGQHHVDALTLGHREGGLVGAPQRAGVDGVHPLEGEVLGQVAGLVEAGLGELGIGRALDVLDPHGQGMADEQELHGGLTSTSARGRRRGASPLMSALGRSGRSLAHLVRTGSWPSQPAAASATMA